MTAAHTAPGRARENVATLRKLVIVALVMFGFGFALVPFYKKLCEVTGLNSIVRADAVTNSQVDTARLVTMEFDVNVRNDLPWTFRPLEKSVRFHPGQLVQVEFEVRNNSARALTGQAIPSWGPQVAGKHFRKLDCFCFTQQTLQPGEVRRMPVVFVVETTLPDDVNYVTMSYTFFQVEGRAGTALPFTQPHAERGAEKALPSTQLHVEGRAEKALPSTQLHVEGRAEKALPSTQLHVEGRAEKALRSTQLHVEGRAEKALPSTQLHVEGRAEQAVPLTHLWPEGMIAEAPGRPLGVQHAAQRAG